MATLKFTKDSDGMAYLALDENIGVGGVHESVPLDGKALGSSVRSLDSFVLDFDKAGRLVGIEVLGNANKVLPMSLLEQKEP